MNALNEIHSEAQTATNAILTDLSDGCARSAKQIYERSEVLENRQEANKVLWELRQRGYVESAPATGDLSDPAARLVWSITEAGRAYLDEPTRAAEPVTTDPAGPAEDPPAPPARPAKPKAKTKPKPAATVTVPEVRTCQCGGTCHPQERPASGAKYRRDVRGLVDGQVDVYAVLVTFAVTCPARQHAIKKLLCAGLRGKGSEWQDLVEAREAIERAIQMVKD